MKNIKKILIILAVILIILIILFVVLYRYINYNTGSEESDYDSGPQDIQIQLDTKITREENDNKFFTINDYINNIFQYSNESNETAVKELVENYTEIENINLNGKNPKYYMQEAYKKESLEKAIYYTTGILSYTEENYTEKYTVVYFRVNIDYINQTYKVNLIDKEEYEAKKDDKTELMEEFSIESSNYNKFEQNSYSIEDICDRYIHDYIIKLKYNSSLAYEILDSEYKNLKFNNEIAKFQEYIQNNKDRIYNFTMQSYSKELKENETEYVILDTMGNYYIIESNGGLNYRILLDNYTIQSEEFVEEYNNATEQEKITTNLSMLIKWLNEKNYELFYSKLDKQFINNNFKNIDSFTTYMQKNFFDNNVLEVQNIEKLGNNYVCEVKIRSGYGLAAEEITKTFIMQLKEGTDLVMSFNV